MKKETNNVPFKFKGKKTNNSAKYFFYTFLRRFITRYICPNILLLNKLQIIVHKKNHLENIKRSLCNEHKKTYILQWHHCVIIINTCEIEILTETIIILMMMTDGYDDTPVPVTAR